MNYNCTTNSTTKCTQLQNKLYPKIIHTNIKRIEQKLTPKYKPIAIPIATQNKIKPQILRIQYSKLFFVYNMPELAILPLIVSIILIVYRNFLFVI